VQTLPERLLGAVEVLSAKLGPVSALIDQLAARLMPEAVARACTGILCYYYCSNSYCWKPCNGWGISGTILYGYYSPVNNCADTYACALDCGCGDCSCSTPWYC
jgi:hypothetical protein